MILIFSDFKLGNIANDTAGFIFANRLRSWWQNVRQVTDEAKCDSMFSQVWILNEEVDYGEWCSTIQARWLWLAFMKVRMSQSRIA